jgi:uncharacterized repeat protein (TIGR03803 family)
MLLQALAFAFVVAAFAMPTVFAQTFQVIHNFTGPDGQDAYAGLTMDQAGSLYGTAVQGGAYGLGVVFKLKRSGTGWILVPLYSFRGGADGANPESRVIIGPDGALYGTTIGGGGAGCDLQGGCGTVYSLKPPLTVCKSALCPWRETVLHRFTGGADGSYPYLGDLVFDHSGNIYGTASGGGLGCEYGCGTVFQLSPSMGSWTLNTIYSFTGGSNGSYPAGGVIFDKAGNLYGTVPQGGDSGAGLVYKLTPSGAAWMESTIYAFGTEAYQPLAGLIFDAAGNLYGTTVFGGSGGGGTVYEVQPSNGSWTATVLYGFSGYEGPMDKLVMDSQGNLYGTSTLTGDDAKGEVFKLAPSNGGWAFTELYAFTGGSDGYFPSGNVILDASGNLYGTTGAGGSGAGCGGGCGVVFEIAP